MQFSPTDFVLATACQDRAVRFWDLETFSLLDSCGPVADAATACCFAADGASLLAAHEDGLKEYSYEPADVAAYGSAAWGSVADLAQWGDATAAACMRGPAVVIWCLERADDGAQPTGSHPGHAQAAPCSQHAGSGAGERASNGKAAAPPCASQASPDDHNAAAHVPGLGAVERGVDSRRAGAALGGAGKSALAEPAPAERHIDVGAEAVQARSCCTIFLH